MQNLVGEACAQLQLSLGLLGKGRKSLTASLLSCWQWGKAQHTHTPAFNCLLFLLRVWKNLGSWLKKHLSGENILLKLCFCFLTPKAQLCSTTQFSAIPEHKHWPCAGEAEQLRKPPQERLGNEMLKCTRFLANPHHMCLHKSLQKTPVWSRCCTESWRSTRSPEGETARGSRRWNTCWEEKNKTKSMLWTKEDTSTHFPHPTVMTGKEPALPKSIFKQSPACLPSESQGQEHFLPINFKALMQRFKDPRTKKLPAQMLQISYLG